MKKLHLWTMSAMIGVTLTAQAQQWLPATPTSKPGVRWWWQGSAVNETDLKWNLLQLAGKGIGAIEITPIYGVKGAEKANIDYLSPKWLSMLRYVQNFAKQEGMEVDMATGTGWPFGGPWVSLDESASKMVFVDTLVELKKLKHFHPELYRPKAERLELVGAYAFKDGTYFKLYPKNSHAPKPKAKGIWRLLVLYRQKGVMRVKRAAPGGQGWVVDHFDRQAVNHYLDYISQAFTSTKTPFPHTFFNDSYEVSEADYTPALFPEFLRRRGYSLEAKLDKLVDGDTQVVSDYRETLSDLLLENFTQTWTLWAHSHGAITRNQAHGSPANLIDCYAAVDIPEIEGFGLTDFHIKGLRTDLGYTRKNDSDFSMLKYAPSAAHICGKPLTSSETFTWLTEHFRTSLSQMKPDLDLMFCAGVNRMFFHGTAYSPKNDPWPGWKFYASVDMSPTNSIWRDAQYLTEYIERCQRFLQWGTPDNDFLVYLPIRDMWAKRSTKKRLMQFAIHTMNELAPEFVSVIDSIDHAGFDCDYISDKYLLAVKYNTDKRLLETAAGTTYKALIIPSLNTLLTEEVRQHIEALKSAGAPIIVGVSPQKLERVTKPEILKSKLGLKLIRRKNTYGYHYFIANLTPKVVDAPLSLSVPFEKGLWLNPLNGERYALTYRNGSPIINLKSGESMILQLFTTPTDSQLQDLLSLNERRTEINKASRKTIDKGWKLHFVESTPNIVDTFSPTTLNGWEHLSDSTKILMGTGVYTNTLHLSSQEVGGKQEQWMIDLGDVRESARVYINGTFVGCAWSVPYHLSFAGLLKPGTNYIRIEVTNLPANRISEMDRKGIQWRKFEEINFVDINYKKTNYAGWSPVPSGLNSPVSLYKLQ